ncbi:MAG: HAD family hydrolase [Clostridia bacterium]|nr:HAD family hydrolase [Clostridia bacterium]
MVKAVLFDLDGTLLNTLPDIRFVLNETLKKYSYPEITVDEARAYIGEGAYRLVERALPDYATNIEEFFEDFKKVYAACANERTYVYEGMTELVTRLKAKGVKVAIITNKPQEATEECVKQFFGDTFDFVGGDSGDFPCKPDPTLARYAALTLRVSPAECVFVGDGETDAQTAINAGMKGVSVLWGYRTRQQLEKAGATRFASSVKELEKFL